MRRSVPFLEVLQFLERHGYSLLKRRKYPGTKNTLFVIFSKPGSPNIGFPVVNKEVAYEHYEKLVNAFEGRGEGEEPKAD